MILGRKRRNAATHIANAAQSRVGGVCEIVRVLFATSLPAETSIKVELTTDRVLFVTLALIAARPTQSESEVKVSLSVDPVKTLAMAVAELAPDQK